MTEDATDLAVRLARLEAVEEIRQLKARYAGVCDHGYQPDPMVELFTEDAVWDGGERFGRHEGRDEIHTFFDGVSSAIVWALHYMIAPDITVAADGLSARGSWYLWQPCTMVGDDGPQAVWVTGRYEDEYSLVDGRWLFSSVHLECQTVAPFQESWVTRPFYNEPPVPSP